MDSAEILSELAHAHGLPKAALSAAAEQREEMIPVFIERIEEYLAEEAAEPDPGSPLFFMFHLLGEWRATEAYRPLARLLRRPDEELDVVLGDAVTGTAHRVMAGVFDGDPQHLYDIILDREADEFVRSAMCQTLAMVVLDGRLDRAEAARFLRDCFADLEPQRECVVWCGWQEAIAVLGLEDLTPLVKKAFDREYIGRSVMDFRHFEEDLAAALADPDPSHRPKFFDAEPFGDTIAELSHWAAFAEPGSTDSDAEPFGDAIEQPRARVPKWWREASVQRPNSTEPAVNPHRGVGRNDPCPCGSGKKFKKCCLNRAEAA